MKLYEYRHASVILGFQEDATNFKKRVPVRLQINDIDLLKHEEEGGDYVLWYPTWVHSFATNGIWCLLTIKTQESTAMGLNGFWPEIEFQRSETNILVSSSFSEKSIAVDYNILFNAWHSFSKIVYEIVIKHHPDMIEYPYWQLLSDDISKVSFLRDNMDSLGANKLKWFEDCENVYLSEDE